MASLFIVQLGSVRKEIIVFLRSGVPERFDIDVTIAGAVPIPEGAYNPERGQYNSTRILEMLKEMKEDDERILGIIDVDLYVPGLNFNFGEADIEGGACIISLTRLRQEFYGLPGDERLLLERTLKEAIHEIGHTYGIGHCRDPRCVMHFSNSLADTDIKGPDFCHRCKGMLNQAQGGS